MDGRVKQISLRQVFRLDHPPGGPLDQGLPLRRQAHVLAPARGLQIDQPVPLHPPQGGVDGLLGHAAPIADVPQAAPAPGVAQGVQHPHDAVRKAPVLGHFMINRVGLLQKMVKPAHIPGCVCHRAALLGPKSYPDTIVRFRTIVKQKQTAGPGKEGTGGLFCGKRRENNNDNSFWITGLSYRPGGEKSIAPHHRLQNVHRKPTLCLLTVEYNGGNI